MWKTMRAGRSRVWAAWVTSALLHALVVLLLLRARARVPRTELEEAEAVEIDVELRAPDPSPLPSPREAGRGDRKDSSRASPSSSNPSPSPSPREAGRGEQKESPASPAPREEGPAVDLSLGALSDDVKGRIAGPPPQGLPRVRPRRFALDELRADLEREREAVANVDAGRADPLLFDYLRGARTRFESQARRLAEDIAAGSGETVRSWARGYLHTVEQVNSGAIGARDDAPSEGGGDERHEKSPHADVLGAYAEADRQAEAGAETRRAQVCLDVAAGRETAVALRRSSGNAAIDRLAVESFEKAAAARPVPPDTRGGHACYELSVKVFRMPPLPFLACSFDIGFSGLTCVWPFKKVISVKGQLRTVEYPPAGGGDRRAAPSLLRKPR